VIDPLKLYFDKFHSRRLYRLNRRKLDNRPFVLKILGYPMATLLLELQVSTSIIRIGGTA
jgi:hypothetical protein